MLNRKIAAVAIAAAVALGTTGCTFISPVASLKVYDPADGVNATVGKVKVRNFMILTTATGQAALFGSLVNQEVDAVATNVEIHPHSTVETPEIPVSVGAGEKLDLGYNGGQALPLSFPVKAGSLVEVHVTIGADKITLNVPVLDGTFAEYAPLVSGIATQTSTTDSKN
ncbi:MAG: hypothetical protein ACKOWR_01870 [Micrococcales bacterium]